MHKHLRNLLENGEDDRLDYKQSISDAGKIAKTLSAFANHKGGRLLVGVRDNRTICGIRSEEERYMLDLAAKFYCKPIVDIEIREWNVGGLIVLECIVPEGKDKPYSAKGEDDKWWVYVRVNDKSLLASKIVVDVLRRQNSDQGTMIHFSSKEKALLDYLSVHERITLQEYRHMLNISRWRASKILVNLISAGVIRSHTNEKAEFYTLV